MNYFLDDFALIGPILEIASDTNLPFIHSYMFGLNKDGFEILKNNIFIHINESSTKDCMIRNIERLLTTEMLKNNYKIKSFLSRFKNIDINNSKLWISKLWNNDNQSCYEIPGNYFGIDVNPFEIIFVKNIRKQHTHRSKESSGISITLYNQIKNYSNWL